MEVLWICCLLGPVNGVLIGESVSLFQRHVQYMSSKVSAFQSTHTEGFSIPVHEYISVCVCVNVCVCVCECVCVCVCVAGSVSLWVESTISQPASLHVAPKMFEHV